MNSWSKLLQWWLLDYQLVATLLLVAGLFAVRLLRQPAQRVAIGWAVSPALILLCGAILLPDWPRWHLRQSVPPTPQTATSAAITGAANDRPLPFDGFRANKPAIVSSSPNRAAAPIEAKLANFGPRNPEHSTALPLPGVLFLTGMGIVFLWLAFGYIEAIRLCVASAPPPVRLREQLAEVVDGKSPVPRLRLSGRVHNAVALGILQPTILLPAALAEKADEKSLRAVLAHEVAHIRNRDLWLLGLLRILQVVLFANPFYWVFRYSIRSSQEEVADAVAAERRGQDYADGLIGWMRQVTTPGRMRAVPAVGIWEKTSEIRRRITMLIDEKFIVQTRVSRSWRVGVTVFAGAAAFGVSLLTLRPASASNVMQAPQSDTTKTIQSAETNTNATNEVFTGKVIDKTSREPISNATVHLRREISSSTEHRVVEETEHVTDTNGQFKFSLTPELSTNGHTYLDFEVTHPNYARLPWNGYALSMIRKNLLLGERPFFEELELTPGESISGTLVRPDGTPAAGVKVLTYSKEKKTDMAEYGSFAEARTDASGGFNVNVVKGGEAVLWLLPQDFSPSTHLLHEQRGDLGRFTLENGIRLSGRVLNSKGSPVRHVWFNAELSGGPAKQNIGMPVADALKRSALTDEQGRYSTGPLPAGDYDILITEYPRDDLSEDRTRYPVRDVFLHQKFHLEAGQSEQSLDIHAVPYVVATFQQVDSQGKPHKTHEITASGRFGDEGWWWDGRPDENGRIEIKIPKGLTDARFVLMVNEHQSTRYRWSDDSPWQNEHEMRAPMVNQDLNDITAMYYTAPILVVSAVAEDGSAIPDFKCQITYPEGKKPYTESPHWINGNKGDVNFEKQQDGRWRSTQLLPDEDLTLTVEAPGFQSWSQTVTLAEGATREIKATLQKAR